MKRISLSILLLSALFAAEVQAQNRRGPAMNIEETALGFVIGDPTGISGRVSLEGGDRAIDGALATGSGFKHWHIHFDYLYLNRKVFQTELEPMGLFWGLGGRLNSFDDGKEDYQTGLGLRMPIGLLMKLPEPQSEVFAEVAPIINVTPRIDLDLDVGVGFRVRF